MPQIKVRVEIDGRPAKRVYVEHIVAGIAVGLYITDNDGRVRDGSGNLGIRSLTNNADIRILGQNSVAKILTGVGAGISLPIWVDKACVDGSIPNLTTDGEFVSHFRILNLCIDNYDNVHRQFRPFSRLANPDFPLGRKSTLGATKDQSKRIEIVFPDSFPQPLAFTEPKALSTGYPLLHIKKNSEDQRLFGTNGRRPTLIPAELSHALHFSRFSGAGRDRITREYVTFLISNIAGGGPGTHDIGVRTSHEVAYIEAMDHFSTRFSEFLRAGISSATGAQLRRDFLRAELDPSTYWLSGETQVATLAGGVLTPTGVGTRRRTNSDDEGTIYGAIFLDFSRRVGMLTAVNAYFRSLALNFGEYRNWVKQNLPQHAAAIDAVAATWRL